MEGFGYSFPFLLFLLFIKTAQRHFQAYFFDPILPPLPLPPLSPSAPPISLASPVTTFFLAWPGNFKLLLFAFDQPPLSPPPPSLFRFISLASLPIKPKTTAPFQSKSKPPHRSNNRSHHLSKSILVAIKVVILALLYHYYNYKQYLHKNVVLAMICVHMYVELELILALVAVPA
ncbi:hypothetical protein V6N13_134063 [Hibiscus sabdariffa]|uniref:Uncharacterized protein n=2 Tax=Hibiscus sabdariffa TaxID=183260 RepID=A0ABR2QZT2_9ROSI